MSHSIECKTIFQICTALQISRTKFWRMRQDPNFPKPLIVGSHCRWDFVEILHYLQSFKASV